MRRPRQTLLERLLDLPPSERDPTQVDCLTPEALRTDSAADNDSTPLPLFLMKITQPALHQMLGHLSNNPPEVAGLLIGPSDDDALVTRFVADETGIGQPCSFTLGVEVLNRKLAQLKPAGLNCKGIGHNHPLGCVTPSLGDVRYLQKLFGLPRNADGGGFYMPIVCGGRLYPYVYSSGHVWHAELVVV